MRYGPPRGDIDYALLWHMLELPHSAKRAMVWNSGPPTLPGRAAVAAAPPVAGKAGVTGAVGSGRTHLAPIERRAGWSRSA
jgi:hypothetical protein